MTSNAGCWTRRLVVLALATNSLRACATDGSEPRTLLVYRPVVEYNDEFRVRAAEELAWLPEGSAVAEMLSDYAVVRDQVRACKDAVSTGWHE